MNYEVQIPKTLNDCTPDQLAKWIFLSGGNNDFESLSGKLDFRVQVVSIFSGVSKAQLELTNIDDINNAFSHIVELLASYEEGEPKGVQIVNGTVYKFDTNFNHMTTGQIIDMKLIEDVYSDPCAVLAILYIEEGMKYNQLDEKERIVNDSEFRRKTFQCEFDGVEFLNVFAFFLDNYKKRKNAIFALSMARTMATMTEIKRELQENLQTPNGSNGQVT